MNCVVSILGFRLVAAAALAQLPPAPQPIPADAQRRPQLVVEQRSLDIGMVVEGEKRTITWRLENRGSANLVIDRTRATCGCTIVQLKDEEKIIPPGGSLDLKAEFDSTSRVGDQNKRITVHTNDPVEPDVTLEFHAKVEAIYEIEPPGMLNIRAVQRGTPVSKTIDLRPAGGRKSVKVKEVRVKGFPLDYAVEPLDGETGPGQRIRFTVSESASLGPLIATAELVLDADGEEQVRTVPIRGDVIGELTWTPLVLDVTRQTVVPGRTLAPVTVRSAERTTFDVLSASAGPMFDVAFESVNGVPPTSAFNVELTLRDGAAPGPFATILEIRTTSLDQPWIGVPVFGMIAPPLAVEPPVVLFRADGTPAGRERRIKLQAALNTALEVQSVTADIPAIRASDDTPPRTPSHIRFLNVLLADKLLPGRYEAKLTVRTNVAAQPTLEIPVTIDVPGGK
ncbi:MAG: DUF1573 domain-containing protein [Planctomycetota bacterium]